MLPLFVSKHNVAPSCLLAEHGSRLSLTSSGWASLREWGCTEGLALQNRCDRVRKEQNYDKEPVA